MSRKSNSPKTGPVLMLAALGATGLSGLAYYVNADPAARIVPDSERRAPVEIPARVEEPRARTPRARRPAQAPLPAERRRDVLVASFESGELKMVKADGRPKEGQEPVVFAMDQTLRAAGFEGARLLSVKNGGGKTTLDFNESLESGSGSMQEAEVIEAIRRTAGQFRNLGSLTLTVEGRTLETLGHFEIETDMPALRPGADVP